MYLFGFNSLLSSCGLTYWCLFLAEKLPGDKSVEALCGCLVYLARVEPAVLDNWLTRLIIGIEGDKENMGKMADNRLLLQSFAKHMVKEVRYWNQYIKQ